MSGEIVTLPKASRRHTAEGVPPVIFARERYSMGVLPLLLPANVTIDSLAITSEDVMDMDFDFSTLTPRAARTLAIRRPDGSSRSFPLTAAIETSLEVDLLRAGGMIPKVLGDIIAMQPNGQEAAA